MKPELDKKIEETLNSLDGIQRAEPQPFFYTRVIGRLQRDEKNVWQQAGAFLSRPAVVVAGLFAILIMNGYILFQQNNETPVSPLAGEQVTNNDYILASSSSFEYENLDPQ